jgi:alkylation response protein AidB-like acyl-CoA dehydrogenase
VVLARTSPPDPEHRHAGFGQFMVPCTAAGVTISPIELMSGEHHFNEVTFDDVPVPDGDVLGEIGNGWHQVTAELSFERSGPERILTTLPLITAAIRRIAERSDVDAGTEVGIGQLAAQVISLRQLSISVARALVAGQDAANRAALVKDLGTQFEQDSVGCVAELLDDVPPDYGLRELLDTGWLHKPLFTLRGGTNEVLRGVVARGMGLR